jgi:two-component system nitrate/nitrite sensor histidine kinase NarX
MMRVDGVSAGGTDDGVRRIVVGLDEGPRGQVALGVPLSAGDRDLGMLVVVRDKVREFTANEARLLRSFGAQASTLLERSLLYQEVAAGAVMQERWRLSREIHDGLAQHLAFLKMRVAWLKRSAGNVTASQLADIEGVLETTLTEARQAITTLRADPQGNSLAEAVTSYAEEFGQVSGLDVTVRCDSQTPEIGVKSRVELLRIVQEALNNVRKHARASHIDVNVRPGLGGVEVTVADDGAGFEMNQSLEGHFGLEIMRERAESVGGKLDVSSSPGSGTRVRIWMPTVADDMQAPADWLGAAER